MKPVVPLLSLSLFLSLSSLCPSPAAAEPTVGIRVDVSTFTSKQGHLVCHLYSRAETFPSPTIWAKEAKADVKGDTATCNFPDQAPGTYAVAVFHDENDNGKLDIGMFGPSEPYGVSNNKTHTFSAPKWDECKFTANVSTLVTIVLR